MVGLLGSFIFELSLLFVQKLPQPSSVTYDTGNEEIPVVEMDGSRKKREAALYETLTHTDASGREIKVVQLVGLMLKIPFQLMSVLQSCKSGAKCFQFPCHIGQIPQNGISSVSITLRARLWNSTFLEEFLEVHQVRIFSEASIVIDPKYKVKQLNTENDVAMVRYLFPYRNVLNACVLVGADHSAACVGRSRGEESSTVGHHSCRVCRHSRPASHHSATVEGEAFCHLFVAPNICHFSSCN
jgi:hypothetical protein